MKINEVTNYVKKYVHPDIEKMLNKTEKEAIKRRKMQRIGYHPSFMAYPYRVK